PPRCPLFPYTPLFRSFGAAVSLILALGPDSSLRGMLFWLMGDLSFARDPGPLLGLLALAMAAGVLTGRHLNVLARGDARAETLGDRKSTRLNSSHVKI